jgi:hypothetical protein
MMLTPKIHGVEDIRQFRPIVLINVIFKFISKAYAIRLSSIAHRTISRTQSAFIRGIYIHEGVLLYKRLSMKRKPRFFGEFS